jgi:hypothetical protein
VVLGEEGFIPRRTRDAMAEFAEFNGAARNLGEDLVLGFDQAGGVGLRPQMFQLDVFR